MTLSTTTTRVDYLGTGTAGPFPYPFQIVEALDLEVLTYDPAAQSETVLTLSADYTVVGAGTEVGGSVTLTRPLAAGVTLTIRRTRRATQTVSIENQGAFDARVLEDALDRLTMSAQEHEEVLSRALTLPRTLTAGSVVPEVPRPRPGEILAWDAVGTRLVARSFAATAGIILPLARTETAETGGFGELTLQLTDPQARSSRVETRSQNGVAAWGNWNVATRVGTAPYKAYVQLVRKQPSKLAYRVWGLDSAGVDSVLLEDVVTFGVGTAPERPALEIEIDAVGAVALRVVGDVETVSVRALASAVGEPAEASVLASPLVSADGGAVEIATGLVLDGMPGVVDAVAYAYSALGERSPRATARLSWTASAERPYVTYGAPISREREVVIPIVAYGPSTERIEVWMAEYSLDPGGGATSVENWGSRPPGNPWRVGEGRREIVLPVAVPGAFVLATLVPYTGFGRRGDPAHFALQALGGASGPPVPESYPPAPQSATNQSVTTTAVTNAVVLPTSVDDVQFLKPYRNSVGFGAELPVTGAAGSTMVVTHSPLGPPGVTDRWSYASVAVDGRESTTRTADVVTKLPLTPTVPDPTIVVDAFDTLAQGYGYSVTPGAAGPEGVLWVFEHSLDEGATWTALKRTTAASGFHFHKQTRQAAGTSRLRVQGTRNGWLASAWVVSAVVAVPQFSRTFLDAPPG